MQLYWLPIEQRIVYKIILFTFQALNGITPQYVADMISYYKPSRCLRSSNANLLNEPRLSVNSYRERGFSVSSPTQWNKLPSFPALEHVQISRNSRINLRCIVRSSVFDVLELLVTWFLE